MTVILKKYTVPVLFFIIGLIVISIGVSTNQGLMFNMASVMLFIAGALSVFLSTGTLKSGVVYVLGGAAGVAAIIALYFSWKSVHDTEVYNRNYAECKALAIQNLQDIRFVQKIYVDKNGKYISDWDELVDFVKNGTMPYMDPIGNVPNRKVTLEENKYLHNGKNPPVDHDMTEEQAYILSKWKEGPNWEKDFKNFKRDTIQKSIMELKFNNISYVKNREKLGFYKFSADSLPYIPFTGSTKKWDLLTKDSVKIGTESYPTLRVEGYIPFASVQGKNEDKEFIYFGSTSINDLSGSWEE